MATRTIRGRLLVSAGVVVAIIVGVPALAAPPLPSATISLAGNARLASSGVKYGDRVAFDHTLDGKVAKNYYLTVHVTCSQGGTMVYDWYGQPDFAFPLIDQSSTQWHWDGGAAQCTAYLRYFANNQLSNVAETAFDVAGSS